MIDEIIIAPLDKSQSHLKIDWKNAAKAAAVLGSLFLGPKGIPAALSNLPDALKMIVRQYPAGAKAQAQGFALYTASLTLASQRVVADYAPVLAATDGAQESLAAEVISALNREPIQISERFFRTPGLNPSFVKVRERLKGVLANPAIGLENSTVDQITSRLGEYFTKTLFELTVLARSTDSFDEFILFFDKNPFSEAKNRAKTWDDYRADINKQIYRRLFLHEMDGHPNITLSDVYIPSRAIYRDRMDRKNDVEDVKYKLHCVDAEEHIRHWLRDTGPACGHSRLITGEPGTGKSTFSLMIANKLSKEGQRVLYIQANSIRSLELSFPKIITTHIQRTVGSDGRLNIDTELRDPGATGKPLLIILDGLDEYDVGGATVSIAAARLVEHCTTVVDEWTQHGYPVRLLLCGRPESASSLTSRFRDLGHHIHIIGFLGTKNAADELVDATAEALFSIDQREDWWRKWQSNCRSLETGLPEAIRQSKEEGVREITAQPLLNYMLAVLELYDEESLTNLSSLYGQLFNRYYERQSKGKSGTFEKICPSLDRFQRIMSEIGVAAWHAGDRSVGVEELRGRFNKPPLKSWFEAAGQENSGLGAILTAFYTRPEDAASPESGLAQRYVFTHKSFREYLTGVGLARFLSTLARRLHPDVEEGWSETEALQEWVDLFGPTPFDQRQWVFLRTELETVLKGQEDTILGIKGCVEGLFDAALRGRLPVPISNNANIIFATLGNAIEAMIGVLSAIRLAANNIVADKKRRIVKIDWPAASEPGGELALRRLFSVMRARPGAPDQFVIMHSNVLFEEGSLKLNQQIASQLRVRADNWEYISIFDFSGMNIEYGDFRSAEMYYGRFHRATIGGADFSNCKLSDADMNHVNDYARELHVKEVVRKARPVKFCGAELHNTRLTASFFTGVLRGASAGGLDVRGSEIKWVEIDADDEPNWVTGALYFRPSLRKEPATRRPKTKRQS